MSEIKALDELRRIAVASLDSAVNAARRAPRECRRCGCEFMPRFPSQRTCDACLGR